MNLVDKIREERNVLASKKAIKNAEDTAKAREINEQLLSIEDIEFAEWFLTEVNIGGKWSTQFAYDLMVKNGKAECQVDKLYITKEHIDKTKISSLIYASHHKNGFINSSKTYADDEFRLCFGKNTIEKIVSGLEEMGIKITTDTKQGMAVNDRPYEVTIFSLKN
jgi:hypothetical protein